MNKKKVFKIIGIILVVVIVIIAIHTIRNFVIIKDLQNKIAQYSNSSNYYTKSVAVEDGGTSVTMEYYKKDNKQVVFMERNLNGEISKISMYDNGERIDAFWDNKENKTVQLDNKNIITVNIYNCLETENNWQTFLGSIVARVKSSNVNGKECYSIKNFLSSTSLTEDSEIYVEKDTGLLVKTVEGNRNSEREYEFDNVDNAIFEEPDISQYTIKDKE